MIDWNKIRNDFPLVHNITYFQSAGTSPVPTPVLQAITAAYRELNEFGDIYWPQDFEGFRRMCRRLADLLQTVPDHLTFVANTSTAMSYLALAMKQQQRGSGNIVSLAEEFPSTTVPWEYQQIPVKYVQPTQGRYTTAAILEQLDAQTMAVVVSYVQYSTGFRLDLHSLGQELSRRGIAFIVNATQGLPLMPVSLQDARISALCASLHKWGFAGHVGSLFYTAPEFRKKFPTPVAGWLSLALPENGDIYTKKNEPISISDSADQYWLGTINFQALKGLDAALQYLSDIGWDNIHKRIVELGDYLLRKLHSLPVTVVSPVENLQERSAILAIQLGDKTPQLVTYLGQRKIYVAYRNGNARISLNIFNNEEEIERLLNAIQDFICKSADKNYNC